MTLTAQKMLGFKSQSLISCLESSNHSFLIPHFLFSSENLVPTHNSSSIGLLDVFFFFFFLEEQSAVRLKWDLLSICLASGRNETIRKECQSVWYFHLFAGQGNWLEGKAVIKTRNTAKCGVQTVYYYKRNCLEMQSSWWHISPLWHVDWPLTWLSIFVYI